jgi:hypothetical protein
MMQGQNDGIFPISGARRAGHGVEAVYALSGQRELVRFLEIPGQPHAYSRPFREPMYGWMAQHLLGQGRGEAIREPDISTLPEYDARLLCDPQRNIFSNSPSVIDLGRKKALAAIGSLGEGRPATTQWVRQLTAPPEEQPHYLAPRQSAATPGMPRKVTFSSEDGQFIPALLWLPEKPAVPPKTVIVADDRGKQAVAQSGMIQPLLDAGFAVFAIDLRGRGEMLGWVTPNYNTSYRLTANQVMFGRPLAGRRAYDLIRAIDYLTTRTRAGSEAGAGEIVAAGFGSDAPAVLLAAAADPRIGAVAIGGYFHSFVSQMRPRLAPPSSLPARWNDPQISGGVNAGDYNVDFGAVIPDALHAADIPDILARIAPRRVLYSQTLDAKAVDAEAVVSRFRGVTAKAGEGWLRYEPGRVLDGELLREWISKRP